MAYTLAVSVLPADRRGEFDAWLGVDGWPAGGTSPTATPRPTSRPAGVPAWWHGDEDATASSLAAMMQARGRR